MFNALKEFHSIVMGRASNYVFSHKFLGDFDIGS